MGYFEVAVGLLFLLALLDLSVGVSNDAVNFLNSAIGSRVATRRMILIVAGAGVFAGSMFSSGIMEVARSGIFNPELFTFADVMVIFLAVMLADVLLLDLFNTFGLPTSTTVSIVFELLGAATAVAILLLLGSPSAGSVIDYINVERATLIIGGIGLSVIAAFTLGTIVQFFSRMLFTFQEKNHTAGIRIGWSAIAFTILSYFLIVKGLKGAAFVPPEASAWIYANALEFTLASLLVWTVIMWMLNRAGIDLLATVVLAGTFALALAFASNDLVNFIGVPLAGLTSWQEWSASGLAPDELTMEALKGPVRGNSLVLMGAGAVMVVTLWVSSKARSVTQTEVNLSRQDEGRERFRPGPLSRGIVRGFVATGETVVQTIPEQWRTGIAERFERERERSFDLDRPAFDKLRASVNLTVASILIVFATSLKLPLSTTFVSFMVAMGTSLSDRAWGRDSAVYRIAGVFSVVGSWFATALAAFLLAGTFALLIKTFGAIAVAILVAAAVFALFHTHRYHARRSRMDEMMTVASPDAMDRDVLTLRRQFSRSLAREAEILDNVLTILVRRKRKAAKKLRKAIKEDALATRTLENEFVKHLNRAKPRIERWLLDQLDFLACERELLQSARTLVDLTCEHVLNEHNPPSERVSEALLRLRGLFRESLARLSDDAEAGTDRSPVQPMREIQTALDTLTELILADLYADRASTQNTTLMLGIALEMRDLYRELERASAW